MGSTETDAGVAGWPNQGAGWSNQRSHAQKGEQPEVETKDEPAHQPEIKAGAPVKSSRSVHLVSIAGLAIMQVAWLGLLSYGIYLIAQLF